MAQSDPCSRSAEVESALLRETEGSNGWPAGTLSQGRIVHLPGEGAWATWTRCGGVVLCAEEGLAAGVAAAIRAGSPWDPLCLRARLQAVVGGRIPGAECSLFASLFCCPSPGWQNPCAGPEIEEVAVEEALDPDRLAYVRQYGWRYAHVLAIRDGTTVLAWSTARLDPELAGRPRYNVGVLTHPEHRRKGYARAVVAAVLERAAAANAVAIWDCTAANTASLMLARSLGFIDCRWTLHWREPSGGEEGEKRG